MQKQYSKQAKNFQRNEKVQVFDDFYKEWFDYTTPLGKKEVVQMALHAERYYGKQNVRIAKVN